MILKNYDILLGLMENKLNQSFVEYVPGRNERVDRIFSEAARKIFDMDPERLLVTRWLIDIYEDPNTTEAEREKILVILKNEECSEEGLNA